MWRRIEAALVTALMVAIGANLVLLVRVRTTADGRAAVSVLRSGSVRDVPVVFHGIGTAGNRLTDIDSSRGPWAVRYVSSKCGFSESDTHGKQLAERLSRSGVQVTVLVPRAVEQLSDDRVTPPGSSQAIFAPMEWIKQFRLTKTPTFLLFNSRGTLVWYHQGTLASEDVDGALAALRSSEQSRLSARSQ